MKFMRASRLAIPTKLELKGSKALINVVESRRLGRDHELRRTRNHAAVYTRVTVSSFSLSCSRDSVPIIANGTVRSGHH